MPTFNSSLKVYKKNDDEDVIDKIFELEKKHEHDVWAHGEKCDDKDHKH
jgi:hypothetical protein